MELTRPEIDQGGKQVEMNFATFGEGCHKAFLHRKYDG